MTEVVRYGMGERMCWTLYPLAIAFTLQWLPSTLSGQRGPIVSE